MTPPAPPQSVWGCSQLPFGRLAIEGGMRTITTKRSAFAWAIIFVSASSSISWALSWLPPPPERKKMAEAGCEGSLVTRCAGT